jgi:serine/threonine-protein kinase
MIPGIDPYIGTKLGSYEIITAIGQGGMARIYKGFHAELNRYTRSRWSLGLARHLGFTDRFRRAQAIAILRHPNIVQILILGNIPAATKMVMEFIDGTDLASSQQYWAGGAAAHDKVRIMRDVAGALDYAMLV